MMNLLVRLFVKDAHNTAQPSVHARYGRLAGWVGILCNILLAGIKMLAGLVSGSIALVGDALNNLSDVVSSVVTLVGFKVSSRPADKDHPFGHARSEYIAGLVVAGLVIVVGVQLFSTSVQKIFEPQPIDYTWPIIIILFISVLVKVWLAVFNLKISRTIHSLALKSTFADARNDAIITGVILICALFARFTGIVIDAWMCLGVAVFIVINGIGLAKDTIDPLLGLAPDRESLRGIADKIMSYPGVLGVHDIIVHDYGASCRFASVHVEMSGKASAASDHEIITKIERDFLKNENIHLIVHYDPIATGDAHADHVRSMVANKVKEIDSRLSIHDFYIEERQNHAHYVFDVAVPPDFEMTEQELALRIENMLIGNAMPIQVKLTLDEKYAAVQETAVAK